MGRPPSVGGGRPHLVTIRLSQAERDAFDRLRGGLDASTYFRILLNRAANVPET